ncbi:MAG: hypothetical protein OEU26_26155 [Candidatus Tectomicrobia bacterium]|nr:hypothetical protein [Candidatus Tectomicrobia bacterium]
MNGVDTTQNAHAYDGVVVTPPKDYPPTTSPLWTGWMTLSLFGIVVAMVLVVLLTPPHERLWAWLGTMLLFACFSAVVGYGGTGLWRGLLIDERNRVSLTRLQFILWTIVVLSGYLIAAVSNIRAGVSTPLAITIPEHLWVLMGISTTSFIASPLIRSTKTRRAADPAEVERTKAQLARQLGVATVDGHVDTQGQLLVSPTPKAARWVDVFMGEETGNGAHLDLAKVQMFYVTLISVLIYAVTLGMTFNATSEAITTLPPLGASMVTLLAMSHTGYLTHKAMPLSQTPQ